MAALSAFPLIAAAATTSTNSSVVTVDRGKRDAAMVRDVSAFVRDCPQKHGTFGRLPCRYLDTFLRWDSLSLLPSRFHPIQAASPQRKDNTTEPRRRSRKSVAIGAKEATHALHRGSCTIADSSSFKPRAKEVGIEIALDLAFQCSPDHPDVKEQKNGSCNGPMGPCNSIQSAKEI